jgi:cell division GTPase FtsZ
MPGLINLDFADVRTIMKDAGSALMGIGRAGGENRAVEAARAAISSPLLEVSITGAQGILFNVSGSANLGLFEVTEAAEEIRAAADPEANIIFGTSFDERLGDEVLITVIATGFDSVKRREGVRPSAGAAVLATESVTVSARSAKERTFLDELDRQRTVEEAEEIAAAASAEPVRAERAASVRSAEGASVRRTYDADDLEIPAFLRRKT